MKRIFLIVLVLFVAVRMEAQDVLDQIASKACECLSAVPDTLDMESFNLRMGLCILEAAMPFEKQLKKEYGINMEKIDVEGERLGRLIGLRLATNCPEGLEKITRMNSSAEEETEVQPEYSSVMGEVVAIDDSGFVVFTIKDSSGKIAKYYWLTLITVDDAILYDYSSLMKRTVNITYERFDFFDPRISEYRSFNVIKELLLMNEF
ncbi:MAG: hypothetical protein ACOYXB_10635 [Bacteroidota bacterium]